MATGDTAVLRKDVLTADKNTGKLTRGNSVTIKHTRIPGTYNSGGGV